MRIHFNPLERRTQVIDFDAPALEAPKDQAAIAAHEQRMRTEWTRWCNDHGHDPVAHYWPESNAQDAYERYGDFRAHFALKEFRAKEPRGVSAVSRSLDLTGLQSWLIGSDYDEHLVEVQTGPLAMQKTAASLTLAIQLGHSMTLNARIESRKVIEKHRGFAQESTDMSDTIHISVFHREAKQVVTGTITRVIPAERHCYIVTLRPESVVASHRLAVGESMARAIAEFWADLSEAQLPDQLSEFLAPSLRCCVCKRPLRDEVSKAVMLGPDCAGRLGVPHGAQAVNRILASRSARAEQFESRLRELGGASC